MIPSLTVLSEFYRRASAMARPSDPAACWEWNGSKNSNGYGKITIWKSGTWYAHRISYGLARGWVPVELDHLCRNRACWRPTHLEPVTHAENLRRSPLIGPLICCKAGHVYAEVGWWGPSDNRRCKACHRRRSRESYQRRKI